MNETNKFLSHHGIKGMKWGNHKRCLDDLNRHKKIIAGVVVSASAVTMAVVLKKTTNFKMPESIMKSARNTAMKDIQGYHKDFMQQAQTINQLRDQLKNLK